MNEKSVRISFERVFRVAVLYGVEIWGDEEVG